MKCLLATAVVGLLAAVPVHAQGDSGAAREPLFRRQPPPPNPWDVSFGAMVWTRTIPSSPLFVDRNTGATLIDTADVMSFGLTTGPTVSIGRWITPAWKIEANYFGFYDWHTTGTSALDAATAPVAILPFPDFLVAGVPALTFNAGDTQQYDYRSNLTNAEINIRNAVSGMVTVLGGFRYLNLNEDFSMILTDQFGARVGSAAISTRNHLFGGQVGADLVIGMFGAQLHGIARFGVFGGVESQTTFGTFLDVTAPNPQNAPARRDATAGQVAFLGELGFRTSYQITANLSIWAGYQILWLENVALAAPQIRSSSWAPGGMGGVDTTGSIFFNGAVTGIELRF